jgi:hypothetical protein
VAVARTGVIGCVFVVFALSACGGSPTPETQIQHSFQRLLTALRTHDAHTVCELLFPFGQHQPAGALAAELRKLDTKPGRRQYQTTVDQCVPSLAKQPQTFVVYYRALAAISVRGLKVHGNQATVRIAPKLGLANPMTFVRAAGEWRLLVTVQ